MKEGKTETPKAKILAQLSTTELPNYGKISTHKAWKYLKEKGLVSERKLELTQGWVSHSDSAGGISLGTGEMDQTMMEKVLFRPDLWKGEKQVIYRLSHEISHKLTPHLARNEKFLNELYGSIIDIRNQHKLGFSKIGNLDFYDQKAKFTEDIVELVNMYILHPNYLKDFLNYLATENKETLKQEGLFAIPQATADFIYKGIEKSLRPIMR